MAIFASSDGNGNVTVYGASAISDGQGHVTLLADEIEEGEVIAEGEVSLSLVDTSGYSTHDETDDAAQGAKDYADEVDARVSEALSQVNQLADSISQLVVTEDSDGGKVSLMEQTDGGWTFNMSSVMEAVKAAQDAADAASEDAKKKYDDLAKQLEKFGSYVSINVFEDGTPYIELGNSGAFKVRITNEKMAFLHVADGVEKKLTTIDTETMNIASATIGDELRVGGLCISKRGNNNVGFTWKEE